jgi:hypothetical protein
MKSVIIAISEHTVMKKHLPLFLSLLLPASACFAQVITLDQIPKVYNIKVDDGGLYFENNNKKYYEVGYSSGFDYESIVNGAVGTENGIAFDFKNWLISGRLYYGLIPYADTRFPQPVFFRSPAVIDSGRAVIDLRTLSGRYDMVGWQKSGKGVIGYRIILSDGTMLFDGRVGFRGTGPFEIDDTIVEGPFVHMPAPDGVVISFDTNRPLRCTVEVEGKEFRGRQGTHHEISVKGLEPGKKYEYTVRYGDNSQTYTFRTAPAAGSRDPFTFSYTSDSRSGAGGGERSLGGANAYIMKKIMAANQLRDVAFMQFSGDLVTGYVSLPQEIRLEYANWKSAIEPFAHHIPVYTTMGNHEAVISSFREGSSNFLMMIDKFPFATHSAEAAFQAAFVNPVNGPKSEDGAPYDPDRSTDDFPSYDETVYYYTYGNLAMVVLNSNYWYAPSTMAVPVTGGNIHAYIMDKQLEWIDRTIRNLEKDDAIDHILLSVHTPMFPNGGHVEDDMWYSGNNDYRPTVAGKRVNKGIIERRDEILDIIVNKSRKVRAVLTGDEHNYCRTEIGPATEIYPENYLLPKLTLSRTFYQVNNGAAGAPYYAQQQTPWTPFTTGFTTQNALVLFHVNGEQLEMEVINPETFEELDRLKLR